MVDDAATLFAVADHHLSCSAAKPQTANPHDPRAIMVPTWQALLRCSKRPKPSSRAKAADRSKPGSARPAQPPLPGTCPSARPATKAASPADRLTKAASSGRRRTSKVHAAAVQVDRAGRRIGLRGGPDAVQWIRRADQGGRRAPGPAAATAAGRPEPPPGRPPPAGRPPGRGRQGSVPSRGGRRRPGTAGRGPASWPAMKAGKPAPYSASTGWVGQRPADEGTRQAAEEIGADQRLDRREGRGQRRAQALEDDDADRRAAAPPPGSHRPTSRPDLGRKVGAVGAEQDGRRTPPAGHAARAALRSSPAISRSGACRFVEQHGKRRQVGVPFDQGRARGRSAARRRRTAPRRPRSRALP